MLEMMASMILSLLLGIGFERPIRTWRLRNPLLSRSKTVRGECTSSADFSHKVLLMSSYIVKSISYNSTIHISFQSPAHREHSLLRVVPLKRGSFSTQNLTSKPQHSIQNYSGRPDSPENTQSISRSTKPQLPLPRVIAATRGSFSIKCFSSKPQHNIHSYSDRPHYPEQHANHKPKHQTTASSTSNYCCGETLLQSPE